MTISPIHRDPETDGDDYGCFTDEANAAVAALTKQANCLIRGGLFEGGDAVVEFMKRGLRPIGDGATDTVVKENAFGALDDALCEAGIHIGAMDLYGW